MAGPIHIDALRTALVAGVAIDAAGSFPNGFLVSPLVATSMSRRSSH